LDFFLESLNEHVLEIHSNTISLLHSPVKGVEGQNADFGVEIAVSTSLKEEGCQLCNMWAKDWYFLQDVSQISPSQQKLK
jgi:hypothetical protein